MSFGEKFKMLRYEKGLTQDDMGYLLNVTKSCISCYEKGTRQPSVDMLIQVSNYFRVSVDYLLGTDEVNRLKRIRLNRKDIEFINLLKDNPIVYNNIINDMDNWIKKARKYYKEQDI